MHLDKPRARAAFAAYVAAYDPSNPRIALKVAHTYRVADLSERIATSEGLDADLAWLCGLLHDIGRFEQVRRFDTFNDAASVPHAALGTQILFGTADPSGPRIRDFAADASEDELVATAIACHSDYRLPTTLDPRTRAYCDLLRDADKIDIIRVNCECPIEDIYGVTNQDMRQSRLSPEVVETFYQHRTIPRNIRRHPADVLVGHICFAWELVYPTSRAILAEQGFLDHMLTRTFDDPATQRTFEAMASHLRSALADNTSAKRPSATGRSTRPAPAPIS